MPVYCIDTSSFIWAMNNAYPIENFPVFWNNLSLAARDKTIISSEVVLEEITRKDDGVSKWAKSQSDLFIKVDDEVGLSMKDIVGRYPKIIDPLADRNQADPWLIALAKAKGATVITQEKPAGQDASKMKIPNVCDHVGIAWKDILGLVKDLNWRFS